GSHHRRAGYGSAMLPQQRARLRQNVFARERGNREGFLSRGCMLGLPGIRDLLELIDHPFEALRRDHLEFEPVAPAALQRIAEAGSAGAIEAKRGSERRASSPTFSGLRPASR